jgi:hypothetical protein
MHMSPDSNFDAHKCHFDFSSDTPGSGPSSPSPSPHFAQRQACLRCDAPILFGETALWLGGLEAKEIVSQEIVVDIA